MWGQVYGQVPGRLSVLTSTKRFYRKGTRRTRKNIEQRSNTKRKADTFWAVSSVRGTFSAVSCVGGTFWAVSRVGGTLLGGIESWRYFLAVSRIGGNFLAEAVKPKYGRIFSAVMLYGGNVLAVGGLSFFGGNTLAVGGITKMWR